MKKLLTFFIAAIAAVCVFAGCTNGNGNGNGNGGNGAVSSDLKIYAECVAFTAKGDYIDLTDTTSVKDYMDALKENGELNFGGYDGDYGFFVESVFDKKAGDNSFWAVYTDLVTLEGDSAEYSNAEWGTYVVNGKTLYSAAYGVSFLPCVEGYTYALVYTEY